MYISVDKNKVEDEHTNSAYTSSPDATNERSTAEFIDNRTDKAQLRKLQTFADDGSRQSSRMHDNSGGVVQRVGVDRTPLTSIGLDALEAKIAQSKQAREAQGAVENAPELSNEIDRGAAQAEALVMAKRPNKDEADAVAKKQNLLNKIRGEAATRKVMHQDGRPGHADLMEKIRETGPGSASRGNIMDDGIGKKYLRKSEAPYSRKKGLQAGKVLGQGKYGRVSVHPEKTDRVVKSFTETSAGAALEKAALANEHKVYQALGEHENIAKYHQQEANTDDNSLTLDRYDMSAEKLKAKMDALNLSTPDAGGRRGFERKAVTEHVGRGIQEGLRHMHGKDYFHNDVKPANIALDAGGTPKLMDMGSASHGKSKPGGGDAGYLPVNSKRKAPRASRGRDRVALELSTLELQNKYKPVGPGQYVTEALWSQGNIAKSDSGQPDSIDGRKIELQKDQERQQHAEALELERRRREIEGGSNYIDDDSSDSYDDEVNDSHESDESDSYDDDELEEVLDGDGYIN